MTGTKYTQDQVDEALGLYRAGEAISTIKDRIGCSPQLLRFWAQRAGCWSKRRCVTPALRAQVLARAAIPGETLRAVAKDAGVTAATVRLWAEQDGIVLPDRRTKYTEEQHARVVELRRQGLAVDEIKRQTGVNKGSVAAILLKEGVTLTPAQRRANLPYATPPALELQVLSLKQSGCGNQAIADACQLPLGTVKTILRRVVVREAGTRYRASPANTIRQRYLKTRYDLTPEAYAGLLQTQGGACAVCRRAPTPGEDHLHVDHDHATGVVRGLLCFTCNVGLGNFEDNETWLETALAYLRACRARPELVGSGDGT